MKVLEENGIPAISDKEEDFMKNGDVEILWALLKLLDNPLQDLAAAAVLRSFFVGLDEKDLTLLHLRQEEEKQPHLWTVLPLPGVLSEEKEEKLRHFLAFFKTWREEAMQDGTAPLLRRILTDTEYLTWLSGLPGGEWRVNHVLAFYQLALARDSTPSSGLYSFLDYLSKLHKEDREFKSVSTNALADAVHFM